MEEVWKDIEGFEGVFQVSNLGRVKSLPRVRSNGKGLFTTKLRILSPATHKLGYKFVYVQKGLVKKRFYVHRLVAEAFVEKEDGKAHVNHKDGNPANNRADNLEWCDQSENIRHCIDVLGKKEKPVVRSDGKRYRSAKEASIELGVPRYAVYAVLDGTRKNVCGYSFRYGEKEN